MSAMVLDKSLDTIIAEGKKTRRPGARPRRSGGNQSAKAKLLGSGGSPAAVSKRKAAASAPIAAKSASNTSSAVSDKIIVSNLPLDVNEGQVKDLFASTVGPVRTTQLQYNAHGKSSGVATVIFHKQGDAKKAFDTYNNRLIDGKRPMKIEIVFDPAKQPLVNRVAAAPVAANKAGGGQLNRKAGGKPARRTPKRPKKTAEDLDAEMADYSKEGVAA